MYRRITDTSTTQVIQSRANRALVTVHTGFTGSLTVEDSDGTTSVTLGVITNPAKGESYEYWDLKYGLRVTCSVAGDVLCNVETSRGLK